MVLAEDRRASVYQPAVIPIPILLPIPVTPAAFDELLVKIWPRGYEESLTHFLNARIELYKAVEAALKKRSEQLEELRETRQKKEKVKVE
jgi:hypothetical protein